MPYDLNVSFVCLVSLVCFVYLVWHQTDQRDGATTRQTKIPPYVRPLTASELQALGQAAAAGPRLATAGSSRL